MLNALLLVPAITGLLAFLVRWKPVLHALLLATAASHAGLTIRLWGGPAAVDWGGWLSIDPAGLLFLSITSLLFLAAAVYGVSYLRGECHLYPAGHQAVFVGCLLIFLATMTLVCLSQHLGLLWVAIEATTLASAPLIYFHRSSRSLEATWKYLVICSVGIALALLGTFFLSIAANPIEGTLILADLVAGGGVLLTPWLKMAFVFFLVGYGTKVGLAPLHTWLPDAHSEAPAMVSCLLSGALLNNAFLGILRLRQVCGAAGLAAFGQGSLIGMGLLSMAAAAVFIVGQTDFKRLLAYSSVEHMGILALGFGLGGLGTVGALFHAINHSLGKGLLFLTAGNILEGYHTKTIAEVRGVRRLLPGSGLLWVLGFLALTGAPPSGAFLSELMVAGAAFQNGHPLVGLAFLGLLTVVFVGMARPFLEMAGGEPPAELAAKKPVESGLRVLPVALLWLGIVTLGWYVPPALQTLLRQAAALLGG